MMSLFKITKSGESVWQYASGVKEGRKSEADYYTDSKAPSMWYGKGAESLGLSGEVKKEDLIRLLDEGAEGQKIQKVRRKATDITFSAPKSVSIVALGLGEYAIKQAHDESVKEALDYIQAEVLQARYGTGGTRKENTNSSLVAIFQHEDARPVDGQVDMNLHSHCLHINSTEDENGWRGMDLDWGSGSAKMHIADAIYKAALAKKVIALGFRIEKTKDGFEIVGVTKEMRDSQSHRTGQIDQAIKDLGKLGIEMTSAERKAITKSTRAEKRQVTKSELRTTWQGICQNMGLIRENIKNTENTTTHVPITGADAISVAIAHLSERQRVWDKDQLILEALKYGVGSVDIHDIQRAISIHPDLLAKGNGKYTTMQAAEQDGWLTAYAMGTRDSVTALQAEDAVDATILKIEAEYTAATAKKVIALGFNIEKTKDGFVITGFTKEMRGGQIDQAIKDLGKLGIKMTSAEQGFSYGDGQREAVKLALTSRDKITGIVGAAGAGKTTAMDGIVKVAHAQDMEVIGLAPTAAAASELSGAHADSTQTIETFITSKDKTKSNTGRLIILDEAGMVGTDDMQKVLQKLNKNDRILLVGDPKQLRSVAAGNAYADYLANGTIQYATINEIKRQKDTKLLAIATAFAEGSPADAMELAQDYMHEVEPEKTGKDKKGKAISTKEDKIRAIVDQTTSQYLSLTPEDRAATIVLSVQNDMRKAINEQIRTGLVSEAAVSSKSTEIQVVHASDMTTEHRRQAHKYSEDAVLREIGRNGTYTDWKITSIDGEKNTLTMRSGDKEKTVDPADLNPHQWRVYEQKTMELAAGDKIVILENDNKNKLYNGNTLDIQEIKNGKIYGILPSGEERIIDTAKPQNLDYAYCLTVHKSQGKTVSNTIFAAYSGAVASAEAAYVAMSREKYRLSIITDSVKEMSGKIVGWSARDTASQRGTDMDMASHEKMDQALEDGAKQAAIHLKTLEIEEEAGGDSGSGNGQVEEAEAGE